MKLKVVSTDFPAGLPSKLWPDPGLVSFSKLAGSRASNHVVAVNNTIAVLIHVMVQHLFVLPNQLTKCYHSHFSLELCLEIMTKEVWVTWISSPHVSGFQMNREIYGKTILLQSLKEQMSLPGRCDFEGWGGSGFSHRSWFRQTPPHSASWNVSSLTSQTTLN